MMIQQYIIPLSFIFFIGFFTCVLAFKIYDNYRFNFLKILFYYTLTSVVLGFTFWIFNFTPGVYSLSESGFFIRGSFVFISFPLIVLKIYLLYGFAALLKKESLRKPLIYIYFSVWMIFFVLLLLNQIFFPEKWGENFTSVIFKSIFHFQFVLLMAIIIYIFKISNYLKGKSWQKGIKIFSILMLFFVLIYYLFSFFYYYPKNQKILLLVLYFAGQFFPLVYFWNFLRKYYMKLPQDQDETIRLDNLILKYKISAREKEVLQLLIQGKSNKEIEEELFISIHTVKAHIQNIYKKLGVKRRALLIHFVKNFKN